MKYGPKSPDTVPPNAVATEPRRIYAYPTIFTSKTWRPNLGAPREIALKRAYLPSSSKYRSNGELKHG